MMNAKIPFAQMTQAQLEEKLSALRAAYEEYKAQGLKLDMSRGKPGADQLDLSMDVLTCIDGREGYTAANGFDTRNYGILDGLPEAKALFADILHMDAANVIVGGNSSLNMMFDYIAQAYGTGLCGNAPWCTQGKSSSSVPSPVMIAILR